MACNILLTQISLIPVVQKGPAGAKLHDEVHKQIILKHILALRGVSEAGCKYVYAGWGMPDDSMNRLERAGAIRGWGQTDW